MHSLDPPHRDTHRTSLDARKKCESQKLHAREPAARQTTGRLLESFIVPRDPPRPSTTPAQFLTRRQAAKQILYTVRSRYNKKKKH